MSGILLGYKKASEEMASLSEVSIVNSDAGFNFKYTTFPNAVFSLSRLISRGAGVNNSTTGLEIYNLDDDKKRVGKIFIQNDGKINIDWALENNFNDSDKKQFEQHLYDHFQPQIVKIKIEEKILKRAREEIVRLDNEYGKNSPPSQALKAFCSQVELEKTNLNNAPKNGTDELINSVKKNIETAFVNILKDKRLDKSWTDKIGSALYNVLKAIPVGLTNIFSSTKTEQNSSFKSFKSRTHALLSQIKAEQDITKPNLTDSEQMTSQYRNRP